MKYRIVYPDGTTRSACYLVGYDSDGKPIHRRWRTSSPKEYTEREIAEMRDALASVFGAFGNLKL